MRHLRRCHLQVIELVGSDKLDTFDQEIVIERVAHSERRLGHCGMAPCNGNITGSSNARNHVVMDR
jgi:hypothetical protein